MPKEVKVETKKKPRQHASSSKPMETKTARPHHLHSTPKISSISQPSHSATGRVSNMTPQRVDWGEDHRKLFAQSW